MCRARPRVLTDSVELSPNEYESLSFIGALSSEKVTSENWERYSDVISWLSPEAFCYYLPGILEASIKDDKPTLIVVESIIAMLDRSPTPEWWDRFFLDRWILFTKKEFNVIQEWIVWLSSIDPPAFDDDSLIRALHTIDLLRNNRPSPVK